MAITLGHLLYISDAIQPISSEQLEDIRFVSEHNNRNRHITGVLFYSAGHFVQLLEGDPGEVHHLYEAICRDPRHENVQLLIERPAPKRCFPDWGMGLLDLTQYGQGQRDQLDQLVQLASEGQAHDDPTPIELEILSQFCMLLPAA